jgi:hypothetical protein
MTKMISANCGQRKTHPSRSRALPLSDGWRCCTTERLKVLWLHECKQNGIQISKEESTEMEEKTGLSLGKATVVDKAARHWLTIIEAWGIGSLVMPGAGNCYL